MHVFAGVMVGGVGWGEGVLFPNAVHSIDSLITSACICSVLICCFKQVRRYTTTAYAKTISIPLDYRSKPVTCMN